MQPVSRLPLMVVLYSTRPTTQANAGQNGQSDHQMEGGTAKKTRCKGESSSKPITPVVDQTQPAHSMTLARVTCLVLSCINNGGEQVLFFEILPIEIRRIILLVAFGQRTIHMELSYGRPLPPLSEQKQQHPRAYNRHACIPYWNRIESKLPKQWNWYSSVCHFPYWTPLSSPWLDQCEMRAALCPPPNEEGLISWAGCFHADRR